MLTVEESKKYEDENRVKTRWWFNERLLTNSDEEALDAFALSHRKQIKERESERKERKHLYAYKGKWGWENKKKREIERE